MGFNHKSPLAIFVRTLYFSYVRTKVSPAVRTAPTFIEAARKAQLITAALETVAGLGFANASLARIAERARISKGVIGYYFPSKDDLVRAVVDSFYLTGHEQMMATLKDAKTATELLTQYIATNIAYIDQNRVATRAISDIIANFRKPDGEPYYKLEDTEPLIAGTAAMFEWGQQTGEFRAFDTRIMAVTLRFAIDGFAGQLVMKPNLDVAAYTGELTDLFLRAART